MIPSSLSWLRRTHRGSRFIPTLTCWTLVESRFRIANQALKLCLGTYRGPQVSLNHSTLRFYALIDPRKLLHVKLPPGVSFHKTLSSSPLEGDIMPHIALWIFTISSVHGCGHLHSPSLITAATYMIIINIYDSQAIFFTNGPCGCQLLLKQGFLFSGYESVSLIFAGSVPSPCHLWVSLEEYWRSAIFSETCSTGTTRSVHLCPFWKAAGMVPFYPFFCFRSEAIPFLIMKSYLLFLQNYIDALHGHKLQVGHSNHAWVCLDLLDMLCQLAERGHASSVRSMLEYPLKHCPELLLLGMSHINVLLLFYSWFLELYPTYLFWLINFTLIADCLQPPPIWSVFYGFPSYNQKCCW
jgi:hypothetical protein